MSTNTHSLKLSNFAALLLLEVAESTGWGTTNGDLKGAFELIGLLESVGKSTPDEIKNFRMTQRRAAELAPEWCKATADYVLSDRARDAAKKGVRTLRDKGALGNGFATVELLDALSID